jgi:ArsR family transcriptional regulator
MQSISSRARLLSRVFFAHRFFFLTSTEHDSILRYMSNSRNENLERSAEMFKALGNSHRLAIFLRLISCCPPGTKWVAEPESRRVVGELGEDLNIAPSTLSHHIKELRTAGLIIAERRGKNIECWVDPEALNTLVDLLAGQRSDDSTVAQISCCTRKQAD